MDLPHISVEHDANGADDPEYDEQEERDEQSGVILYKVHQWV